MRTHFEIPHQPDRSLADRLFELGVEFPCGGESACGGCKIRVLSGHIPITETMRQALSEAERAQGWRLACCAEAGETVVVEVDQWSLPVLTDERSTPLEPRPGFGAVIDLGTTTLVAQIVDLSSGEVLSVETALNPQARHGADVMSRIQYDLRRHGELTAMIRRTLGEMLARLAAGRALEEVLLAGNTAMHHLFCGLNVEPLAAVPFLSPHLGERRFSAGDLGWGVEVRNSVRFLPCLGGFVGSDLLAGIVATRLHEQLAVHALFDIGTNGEIVLGSRDGILCASTAAGPAFEGGRISAGMTARPGAIDAARVRDGRYECHVLGGSRQAARGICGSGLVDAIACGLGLGQILPNGRLAAASRTLRLTEGVSLTQADIRELQLAKGAMAAGLKLLHRQRGRAPLRSLWLAGAFGNYIKEASARAIGLLPQDVAIQPVGNSALRGTRMLLLTPSHREPLLARLCAMTDHIELAAGPAFQNTFADSMALTPYRLA
ncbi:MAG: ASKHA domain-containing protein [Bryobacteraceae bacterium]|jgi:uncharacterized 2Fe-2S/4Fe-4S cluster protein (DUF4445 family)